MRILAVAALMTASACSMNPPLEAPPAPVPAAFPSSAPSSAPEEGPTAATLSWRDMFGDPRLHRLIELALANNRDVRAAMLNVEAARSQFRISQSARLPQVDANGSRTRQRTPTEAATAGFGGSLPESGGGPSGIEFGQYSANLALTSFEIDLFGRLRSQSEAAWERYLATGEGRRAARISLVGAVAEAYFDELLAVDQLALTDSTLADWASALGIARRLHQARQVSGVDVAQAEGQVHQAQADRAARSRALAQARNALQLLVGAPPDASLPPPIGLMDQPVLTGLKAGLPSDLIVHRPDIRQAEHELAAANADIGAARAAFLPRISLTGLFGLTSLGLDTLFNGANRNWSFVPTISQPIFRGGSLRGLLELAQVRKSIAVAQYEGAIQSAFREVADGIAGRETFSRQFDAQRQAWETARKRTSLSDLRYRAGVDSRLELLDAQRQEYATRQAMLDLRREQLSSAARLYRALGGGDEG